MPTSVLPEWWLVVSAVCFGCSILFNVVLVIAVVVLIQKVGPLLKEVREQLQRLGDKANDITTTAKTTVDTVHDRTELILGGAQDASARVTSQVSRMSAALTALFVALRVVGFLRGAAGLKTGRARA